MIFQFFRQKYILTKDVDKWNMTEYKDSPYIVSSLLKTEVLKLDLQHTTLEQLEDLESKIKDILQKILEISKGGDVLEKKKRIVFIDGRLAFINQMLRNHFLTFKTGKNLDLL